MERTELLNKAIQDHIDANDPQKPISEIFADIQQYFTVYFDYTQKYNKVYESLKDERIKNKEKDDFFAEAEDETNFPVECLLLTPIQHLLFLSPLLESLLEYSTVNGEDSLALNNALSLSKSEIARMSILFNEVADGEEMQRLEKTIDGFDVAKTGRRLFFKGEATKFSRKTKDVRTIIIFSDGLFIGKGNKFTRFVPLGEYRIKSVEDKGPFLNAVDILTKKKSFRVNFDNPKLKDRILSAFTEACNIFRRKWPQAPSNADFAPVCTHDIEQDKVLRYAPPTKLIRADSNETKFRTDNRKPIRVHFDTSPITSDSIDSNRCFASGQIKNGQTCQAEDVLTADKTKVILETIKNVQQYIHNIVNVTQYEGELTLRDITGLTGVNKTVTGIDLYLFVVSRPFGSTSSTLATASTIDVNYKDEDKGRPVEGLVTINPAKVPSQPQNASSGDRQFFVTIVHELMHVLAFSANHFNRWVDRATGQMYPSTITQYVNSYGLTQRFISTPKLTEWVNDRFQVLDKNLATLGLEIEDGGGSGTAGSHPNSRLYFTDAMQGITYGPGYFTGVFFYTLYDSGWYDPNYTFMEELVYMNMKLHKTSPPNQNVLVMPPKLTFPSDYFCSSSYQNYCYYDYSTKANCNIRTEAAARSSTEGFPAEGTNESLWINPDGGMIGSEELLDYAPVLTPTYLNCRNPNVPNEYPDYARSFETYGPSSVCAYSTMIGSIYDLTLTANPICVQARCGSDGKIRLILKDGVEYLCTRKGKKVYQKGRLGYVECPNADEACANLPKTPMIDVQSVIPDRGPSDGGNFLSIIGKDLNTMQITELKFGDIDMLPYIVTNTDDGILLKLPKDTLQIPESIIMVPQTLSIKAVGEPDTQIQNFYTFTSRTYDSNAVRQLKVSAVLIVFVSCALSFLI
ncbi:GP63-like protein [Histomonas meleagridis]|uniref:uncharacterized protein n=1 Tax=Histomonas meleagridis TaxID=135588 RepID=UPI003559E028|nr:GP63-like protein [Histomonas meleagridis]KAH0798323.1 hypothetical protein GO595_008872 [Histomonas meleagridis]